MVGWGRVVSGWVGERLLVVGWGRVVSGWVG